MQAVRKPIISNHKKKSSEQARRRRNDTSALKKSLEQAPRRRNDTSALKKSLEQAPRRRNYTSASQEDPEEAPQSLKIIEKLSLNKTLILYSELELDVFNKIEIQDKKFLEDIKSLQLKTYLFYTLFYSISILFRGARALSRKSIIEYDFSEVINKISNYLKILNNKYYELCLDENYKKFITSKSIQKMYNIAIDTNDDELKKKLMRV